MTNLYLGVLSGTSMDSIDVAAISFDGPQPVIHATMSHELPIKYKETYLNIIKAGHSDLNSLGELDKWTGELFANAVIEFIKKHKINKNNIKAIGSHGQTLWHAPQAKKPFTMQLGDPNLISYLTGITTIADFRRADVAAGGQGAPLAPAFHKAVFSHDQEARCIVNIGGFSNISVLAQNRYLGFDSGPGNCLMDYCAHSHFNLDFDANGALAASGEVNKSLLSQLLDDPYFKLPAPKSTGREYFTPTWLKNNMIKSGQENIPAVNVLTTLLHLTVASIATAIKDYAPPNAKVFLCGGGAKNLELVKQLSIKLNREVLTTAALGVDPQWVEAALFAWLAKQRLDNTALDLSTITGSKSPVMLGGIY